MKISQNRNKQEMKEVLREAASTPKPSREMEKQMGLRQGVSALQRE